MEEIANQILALFSLKEIKTGIEIATQLNIPLMRANACCHRLVHEGKLATTEVKVKVYKGLIKDSYTMRAYYLK